MATINAENPVTTAASPGKNIVKPMPLGDATNMDASMKDKVVRTHTKFDEEGEVTETTVTEIEEPAAVEATEEASEEATEEAPAEASEAEAQGKAEEVEDADAEAKLAYRSVQCRYEKERSAKWEGKHTRFPEDDAGEEDATAAPVSAELQAQIDDLSSAVSTAMVVETPK